MPPKIKSEQDREKLRASILDAARTLIVERGIDAVSMREIAKKINYSATTLYHHFADKEALLQAVCDEDFLKLASGMHQVMQLPDLIARDAAHDFLLRMVAAQAGMLGFRDAFLTVSIACLLALLPALTLRQKPPGALGRR